jgi:hypothetical protein
MAYNAERMVDKKEMKKNFSYSNSALRSVEEKIVISKIGTRRFYQTKY